MWLTIVRSAQLSSSDAPENYQVDRVWSKSDNVVLPNFKLEVVAESPITIATKAKSLSKPLITEEFASKADSVEEVPVLVSFILLHIP
jgi:hypothetical protein